MFLENITFIIHLLHELARNAHTTHTKLRYVIRPVGRLCGGNVDDNLQRREKALKEMNTEKRRSVDDVTSAGSKRRNWRRGGMQSSLEYMAHRRSMLNRFQTKNGGGGVVSLAV